MKKTTTLAIASAMAAVVSLPVMAGNGAPSGSHYNLNIIGVENPKTADMTDSNRHTIFVGLGRNGAVTSKINLYQGEFKVLDGNGTDSNGAAFQLPANNCEAAIDANLPSDDCTNFDTLNYSVWARALGQPGGKAEVTTCRTDTVDSDGNVATEELCSTETLYLEVTTGKGSKQFEDVTKELTTLCLNIDADPQCDVREQLFDYASESYWWDYVNKGLRLLQLRFYLNDNL